MSTPPRPESLRLLEHEVGVLIRRVKRVIGQRSRAVLMHPGEQQVGRGLQVRVDRPRTLAEHAP